MKVVCIEPFKGKEFDINQQGGIRYGISYDVVNQAFGEYILKKQQFLVLSLDNLNFV